MRTIGISDILTIDKAQGIDKSVIIISSVIHSTSPRVLKDLKRINVAFTRAKCKMILVGSFSALKDVSPIDKIVKKMREKDQLKNILRVTEFWDEHIPTGQEALFEPLKGD